MVAASSTRPPTGMVARSSIRSVAGAKNWRRVAATLCHLAAASRESQVPLHNDGR